MMADEVLRRDHPRCFEVTFECRRAITLTVEVADGEDARSAGWRAFERAFRDPEWQITSTREDDQCPLSGHPLEDCPYCRDEACAEHGATPCDCDSGQRHYHTPTTDTEGGA